MSLALLSSLKKLNVFNWLLLRNVYSPITQMGFKKYGGHTVNTGYIHIQGYIAFSRSTMMILSITGVVLQTKVYRSHAKWFYL